MRASARCRARASLHLPDRRQVMSSMRGAALELVGLTKRFGPTIAVDHISLKIAPGTYCYLLGPSGCGKTTTLRMIAGHESVSAGDILLGASNISDLSPAKRGTAMMFQSYALFPHLSALDNVAFSLKMQGVAKATRHARAGDMLRLVAMLRGMRRAAVFQPARAVHNTEDLSDDAAYRPPDVDHHAPSRLRHRLFPRLPRALLDRADRALSRLHHSVLDVERHSHDFLDSPARSQRADQPGAAARTSHQSTAGMVAVFRVCRRPRLRAPVHAVHDRTHLQLDDAHRAHANRGGHGLRRLGLADARQRGDPAQQARYRHRLHLCAYDRDG